MTVAGLPEDLGGAPPASVKPLPHSVACVGCGETRAQWTTASDGSRPFCSLCYLNAPAGYIATHRHLVDNAVPVAERQGWQIQRGEDGMARISDAALADRMLAYIALVERVAGRVAADAAKGNDRAVG